MSKGTIIYVGYFDLPDKNASANRVVANGKIFEALGYRVVFLGSDYSDDHFHGIAQLDGFKNMYVEHHARSANQWFKQIVSVDNIARMLDLYSDAVAVILYNQPYIFTKKVYNYLKGSGIKVYYDCTEWSPYTDGNFIKQHYKKQDEKLIRNDIHKYVDGMIVVGSVMKKHYEKKTKVLVLPPLVDISDPIWHQDVNKSEKFEFCFAGVPGGNKESLDKVVEAFLTIKQPCTLKIAGLTVRDFFIQYPNCNKELTDDIVFTGYRSHNTAVSYILACDAYIFLRQSDRRNNAGFPTKFVESYTAGKPIITTSVSDIPSYIINGENGYIVDVNSVTQIADAMNKLISEGRKETNLRKDFDFTEHIDKTARWLKKTGLH